jgi:uncharacterized OsmC-like protein
METQRQEPIRSRGIQEVNGVDIARLNETIAAIKKNNQLSRFKFRASNEWVMGAHNRSTIKPFYGAGEDYSVRQERFVLDADAPDVLLGTDTAADPVEFVLHALQSCMTTTMVYHGAAQGINISKLESTVEGDLDLQGFLGLSESTRKGFQELRVTFNVECDASEGQLRELIKFSPVYEMVSASVPINISFHINKPILS